MRANLPYLRCQLLLHWCIGIAVANHVINEANGLGGTAAQRPCRDRVHPNLRGAGGCGGVGWGVNMCLATTSTSINRLLIHLAAL
jgi:hypothetical protein